MEGEDHLLWPMVTALHITQDDAGLLFYESALLVCDQLVHQDPSGLVCRASFQQVGPWCTWCLCLFFSTVLFRTLHFPLLKFMRFLLNQPSSLSRSHVVPQLCGVSAAPPSFASSGNLLRCTLSHHFRSLVKLLNSINPSNDPWITPLVTCRWLHFVLLITTHHGGHPVNLQAV